MLRVLLGVLLTLVVGFSLVTCVALEASDVAIVETRKPDGTLRETHVWFIEEDGVLWLEAGTPENGWHRDVLEDPRLHFAYDPARGDYLARPLPEDRARHAQLREKLRAKYGWRDAWVSLYVDQSRSLAVRLDPAPGDAP